MMFAVSTFLYLFTLLLGLFGNSWVIASLFRTSKRTPFASGKSLNPSDRLRKYIWLLSLFDLFVSSSLAFRVWVLLLSDGQLTDNACRWVYAVDQTLKTCSLTCLACISIERFITIRKPFNNKTRKMVVRMTPLFALFTILFCGGAILWLSANFVGSSDDELNCIQRDFEDSAKGAAADSASNSSLSTSSVGQVTVRLSLAIGFFVQLGVIESNYVRIVLHVKRKFWQRKARAVANCICEKCRPQPNSTPPISVSGGASPQCACVRVLAKPASLPSQLALQAEPRYPYYMREMTTTIRRIALFHLVCWLPYCLLSLLPTVFHADLRAIQVPAAIFAVRTVDGQQHNWTTWAAVVVNWLTYCNSAGNWVLYAALNRNLRSIIKASSERRKRSTMLQPQPNGTAATSSQQTSPTSARLKRSVRCSALQSLRFFYSLNSHRSSADSTEGDFAEAQSVATPVGQSPHNGPWRPPSALRIGSLYSARISLHASSVCTDSVRRIQSSVSSDESPTGADGIFGWRDEHVHS